MCPGGRLPHGISGEVWHPALVSDIQGALGPHQQGLQPQVRADGSDQGQVRLDGHLAVGGREPVDTSWTVPRWALFAQQLAVQKQKDKPRLQLPSYNVGGAPTSSPV